MRFITREMPWKFHIQILFEKEDKLLSVRDKCVSEAPTPTTDCSKRWTRSPRGQSWTAKWPKLIIPTLRCCSVRGSLTQEKYVVDQDAFLKDDVEAHAKLINLGAKFDTPKVLILLNDTCLTCSSAL
ncbi:L-ascorbate peroxidase S-chloroplastic/mitochondrial [Striga hermonthica]|uniref:L-ascorbate peroxidase S-chloroplastic/mitochondrial n=1 Tax=Striga hermonthica TaxID=68872 RepID=A0A9N7R7E7_STRHE|nr:L-ascorbate peroxidase S-chloroplastic/mitochondrial [Striga hermonthica]